MKEQFKCIPKPLQKQILIRIAGAVLGLFLFILLLIFYKDWRFWIPCVILSVMCLASAGTLFYRCVFGKYVVVEGVCTDIDKTLIRRRIKAVYIRNDSFSIKIVNAKRIKNLSIGDIVTVYVADNSAVYDVDGMKVICYYLAMTKGERTHEDRTDLREAR